MQVGAIYPYNEAETKKAKEVTMQPHGLGMGTDRGPRHQHHIKLREWVAITKCLHRIFTHKAVPTVVAVVDKVSKICRVELFINLLQKSSK